VVEVDDEEEKPFLCPQKDLLTKWYHNDSTFPLDGRLDTHFYTLQAQRQAEAASVQSIEAEQVSVCKECSDSYFIALSAKTIN